MTKDTAILFFVYFVLASCLTLYSVRGTQQDPLGGVRDGSYDWSKHARRLTTLDPSQPSLILKDPGPNDPLDWDDSPPRKFQIPGDLGSSAPKPEAPTPIEDPIKKAERMRLARQKAKGKELAEQGARLLRSNRFKDARRVYTEAAKLDPALKEDIAVAFYKKGVQNQRRKTWSRAQILYRSALHFDFNNPRYHDALATVSDALGDKDKAKEHRRLAAKYRGT